MNLNYSKRELAEIWWNLNCFNWDKRIGEEPEDWAIIPDFHLSKQYKLATKRKYVKPLMTEIENKIGRKECMKWHHINNCDRSRLEFEIWWINRWVSKLLGIGFYSKKLKREMSIILNSIADKQQTDFVKKKYGRD